MAWTKHFRVAQNRTLTPPKENAGTGTSAKYSSFLPEIFAGHPNRVQRYYQFEEMSRDSDVAAALDTIADFCTQSEEQSDQPFFINFLEDDPTESEVNILNEAMTKWVKKNEFKKKLWRIFRDTIKNGDTFFVCDPETHEWHWVDHYAVELVKVSSDGRKKPQEYVIRNFDPNITEKFATVINDISQYRNPGMGAGSAMSSRPATTPVAQQFQIAGDLDPITGQRQGQDQNQYAVIEADKMIHLSLNEKMDNNWPFGASILEPIFKTYKQKEMLEDAILIYRVQRAPERRIFYIDVGEMSPIRAKGHIEAIKNEIHQRRIPTRAGGGSSMMDAAYNPVSMMDDYFFAQTADGRGSKVETLPGGEMVGEIGDLTYFTKKMARGMRIPTSYLSLGDEEAPAMYNDGKLGQTMIQEFKFNKYCIRLQQLLAPVFDKAFKSFLDASGVSIDENLFEIQFHPPQNFTIYRQIELDLQRTQVYGAVQNIRILSERYKLERYLGLREDEIIRNEKMWAEENANKLKKTTGTTPAESEPEGDLNAVGVRPPSGGAFDFGPDEMGDEPPMDSEGGEDATGDMGDGPPEMADMGGAGDGPSGGPQKQ